MARDQLEVAHVQYYGWALTNRAALMPTRSRWRLPPRSSSGHAHELRGRLAIDYVIPDYWAKRPKPCMGGWGSMILNVTPQGKVMPCHAAASIPGLVFTSVRDRPLRWIWQESPTFQRFRGTDWMPDPCRSCALKEVDFGGCRCQALALTGDASATDPACELSPLHAGDVHGRASRVRLRSHHPSSTGARGGRPRARDDSAGGGRTRRLTEIFVRRGTATDGSHASTMAARPASARR